MHIPDGFIDEKTAATTGLPVAAGVGLVLRQVRRRLAPRRVPLLGLAAADEAIRTHKKHLHLFDPLSA